MVAEIKGTSNHLEEWLEWFSRNRARVDMTSAAAAGIALCLTGLMLLKISMLDRVDPLDLSGFVRVVLITTIPYLVAGLVIHLLWSEPVRRKVPSWIMIALAGAWLVVVSAGAWAFFTNALGSNTSGTMFETIVGFILDKAKDGVGVFVVLSLLTLPITASVYYAGSIVGGIRRWHHGAEPPSILRE